MKLKTLQDLNREIEITNSVNTEELKAEAIKWVKSLSNYDERPTIDWIKHFFNITEENLK